MYSFLNGKSKACCCPFYVNLLFTFGGSVRLPFSLWIWRTTSFEFTDMYAADACLPPWVVPSFSHLPSILFLFNFLVICWCEPLKLLMLLYWSSEDKLRKDWMRMHVNGERTSACDHDGWASTHKSMFSRVTIEVIWGFIPHSVCPLFSPSLRIIESSLYHKYIYIHVNTYHVRKYTVYM